MSSMLSYCRQHKFFLIVYISFLVTGLIVFKDYGISWDETACRYEIGLVNHNFIFHGDYETLINNAAKYHGPSFEVLLYETEVIFKIADIRDVFLMRHLLTFLLFALSVFFFYRLCLKIFSDKHLAVLGTIMLILSPRIFADSFYNSKDIGFLSMWIISMFTTLKFLESRSYKTGFISAVVTAFMVDIRIIGIINPIFIGFILLLDIIRNSEKRFQNLKVMTFYALLLIGFIILFWPVMWKNPVGNFIQAFIENSKFPWQGEVLVNGRFFRSDNLPFYYLPLWIGVTTPILYLLLFLSGLFFLSRKIILTRKINLTEGLNLYSFFLPIISVIALHSVLYDGWRHLFFIYPSFIIICICGISYLKDQFKNNLAKNISVIVLSLYGAIIICQMILLHPFENLYFNRIAGKSLKEIKGKYELDYWALSYRNCLEFIAEHDTSSSIWVFGAESSPASDNSFMLNNNDRSRIFTTESPEIANYYATAYRYIRGSIDAAPFYNLTRDEGIIASVYNTRTWSAEIFVDKYLIAQQIKTYEESEEQNKPYVFINEKNSNSNHVEKVDQKIDTAAKTEVRNISINDTAGGLQFYIVATFEAMCDQNADFKFVTEIDSAGDFTTWTDKKNISIVNTTWTRKEVRLSPPNSFSKQCKIKVYILNNNKVKFYVDDISLRLYGVPKELVKNILKKIPKPKGFNE